MVERDRGGELLAVNETGDIENVYLTFDVQDEEYAVSSAYVTEIVELQKISKVMDIPQSVEGVIHLRDRVVPVMDMRLHLGLPWREYGVWPTIIVLESNDVPTGLVVDRVTGVVAMSHWQGLHQCETPHQCGEGERVGTVRVPVIKRLDEREDGASIVLDVPRLLYAQGTRLDLSQEVLMAAEAAVAEKISTDETGRNRDVCSP